MKNNLFFRNNVLNGLCLLYFGFFIFSLNFLFETKLVASSSHNDNDNQKKKENKEEDVKRKTKENRKKLQEFINQNKNTNDKKIAGYVSEANELLKIHDKLNCESKNNKNFAEKISKNGFITNSEKMNKLVNIISGKNKLIIHGREKQKPEMTIDELKLIQSGSSSAVNKGVSRRTISDFDQKNDDEGIKKIINNHDLKNEVKIKEYQNVKQNDIRERDIVGD